MQVLVNKLHLEINGNSSVMLLEDCISERILFHGSEEEKQETGLDFTHSSLLRITGLSNKIISQNKLVLHCTVLRIKKKIIGFYFFLKLYLFSIS